MKKIISVLLVVLLLASMFAGCAPKKETIIIYSCANNKRIAYMGEFLQAKFPEYEIIVEYMGTSKLSAKILAEGKNTDADIIHDLSYLNMDVLDQSNLLADVSFMDTSKFVDGTNISKNYLIECRTSGSVIVNKDVLAKKNLPVPTCFEDLLKPEYKGLISMPDPKSSSTGYMFVKALVNAWGEEKAMEYFAKLSENILQFTSGGNGPVNALVQQEVAIGLGIVMNAVEQIDDGINLEILFFEPGAAYAMYGQTIIAGKETRESVKAVFKCLVEEYLEAECTKFGSESIIKDKSFASANYPSNITYCDMSNDTLAEKERLLQLWTIT